MPLPSITEEEHNELLLQRQLRSANREEYRYRPPDTSALEQMVANPVQFTPPPPAAPLSAPPAAGPPSSTAGRSPEQLMALGQSQFNQPGVTYAEALAACGPAAAIAFAATTGRPPSLQEALVLARQTGWTEGGQAGPQAQQKLLTAMGVPTRLEAGVNWGAVQQDVQNGNPVMLSSSGGPGLQGEAGHYWQILGYRPEDDRYFVGPSGTAYRGGKEWMSPEEIARVAGQPSHALYLDNPFTPGESIARRDPSPEGLRAYARGAAQRAGFDPDVFERQIQQENGFKITGASSAGAQGIAQIVPQFHPGVNVNDPFESLDYAAKLMAGYVRQYGSTATALAAYNAGPGAVKQYGGVPPFEETRRYLAKILPDGVEPPIPEPLPGSQLPPQPGRTAAGAPDLAAINRQAIEAAQSFVPPPSAPSPFKTYTPPLRNIGANAYGLGQDPVLGQSSYDLPLSLTPPPEPPPPQVFPPAVPGAAGMYSDPLPNPQPAPVLPSFDFGEQYAARERAMTPPVETIRPREPSTWQLPSIGPYTPPPIPLDNPVSAIQNAAARYPQDPLRGVIQGAAEAPIGAIAGAGPAANAGLRALLPDLYAKPEAALRYQPTPEQIAATQLPLPFQGREVPGLGRVPEGGTLSPLELIPPEGLGVGAVVENALDPTNFIPGAKAGHMIDRLVGGVGRAFERAADIPGRAGMSLGRNLAERGAVTAAPPAGASGPLAARAARRAADRVRQSVTPSQPELPFAAAPTEAERAAGLATQPLGRATAPERAAGLATQSRLPGFEPSYGQAASANALLPPSTFGIGQAAERTAATIARQGAIGAVEGAGGGVLAARTTGGEDTSSGDYLKYGTLAGLAGFALGAFPRGTGARIGEAVTLAARGGTKTEAPANLAEAEAALGATRAAYQAALRADELARATPEALARHPDLVKAQTAVTAAEQALAAVDRHADVLKANAAVDAARAKYEAAQHAVANARGAKQATSLEKAAANAEAKIAEAEAKAQQKLLDTQQALEKKHAEALGKLPTATTKAQEAIAKLEVRAGEGLRKTIGPVRTAELAHAEFAGVPLPDDWEAGWRDVIERFRPPAESAPPGVNVGNLQRLAGQAAPDVEAYLAGKVPSIREGGLAVGDPGLPEGPEKAVNDFMSARALASPDGVAHASVTEMFDAFPQGPRPEAPFSPQRWSDSSSKFETGKSQYGLPRTMDELRLALDIGMPWMHWYHLFATEAEKLVGQDNMREWSALFAATSPQTSVEENFAQSLAIMRWARELARDDLLTRDNLGKKWEASRWNDPSLTTKPKRVRNPATGQMETVPGGPPKFWGSGDKLDKAWAIYKDGFADVKGLKTASYGGNILNMAHLKYDPHSVIDTWMAKLFGFKYDEWLAGDNNTYRLADGLTRYLARERGIAPNQAQAAMWFAMKQMTEHPATKSLRDAVDEGRMSLGEALLKAKQAGVFESGEAESGDLTSVLNDPKMLESRRLGTSDEAKAAGLDIASARAAQADLSAPGTEQLRSPGAGSKGAQPLPVGEAAAESGYRSIAERQAPVIAIGSADQAALGLRHAYDLEDGTPAYLMEGIELVHRVVPTDYGLQVVVPGGNRQTTTGIADVILERLPPEVESIGIHVPDVHYGEVGGIQINAQGEQLDALVAALKDAEYLTSTSSERDFVRVVVPEESAAVARQIGELIQTHAPGASWEDYRAWNESRARGDISTGARPAGVPPRAGEPPRVSERGSDHGASGPGGTDAAGAGARPNALGAFAGAGAGQLGTEEETSPEERLVRGLGGAAAGFAGFRAGGFGRRAASAGARAAAAEESPTQAIADAREAFRAAQSAATGQGKSGLPQAELADLAEAVTRYRASEAGGRQGEAVRVLTQMARHPELVADPGARARTLLSSMYKNRKEADFAKYLNEVDLEDPLATARAIKVLGQKNLGDYASWAWYNSLLSAPVGRIRDLISTQAALAAYPLEKAAAVPIDAVIGRFTGKRTIYGGEVAAEYAGMAAALGEGVQDALDVLRHGATVSAAREDLAAVGPEAVQGPFGGALLNAPTRLVKANDALARAQAQKGIIYADAYRLAKQEGLKGDAFAERAATLRVNPTDEMIAHAQDLASEKLWQKTNLVTEKVGHLKELPGMTAILPFHATPINLAKFAMERSPIGFGMLGVQGLRGKATQQMVSEGVARASIGSALMAGMYGLAQQDLITGQTPSDAAERDEWARIGKQPYSIKIGDTWHSYQLLPIAPVLAAGPAIADAVAHKDADSGNAIYTTAALAMARAMTDQPMMQTLAQALDAVHEPEKKGGAFIEGLARSVVPGVVGAAARASDERVRNPEGPWEAILAVIPGANQLVPERQTAFGQPAERAAGMRGVGGLVNPFRSTPEHTNLVERELTRLHLPSEGYRVQPGMVGRTLQIGSEPVRLTREEQATYQGAAGQLTFGLLYQAMNTPEWKGASDEEQRKYVHQVYAKAREQARGQVIPQLQERARGQEERRRERLAG